MQTMVVLTSEAPVVFDRRSCQKEQSCSKLYLGFEVVTGIRAVTSKWSLGLAVDFEGINTGTLWKWEQISIHWHNDVSIKSLIDTPYKPPTLHLMKLYFFCKMRSSFGWFSTKIEQNKICRSKLFPQTCNSFFFCRSRFDVGLAFLKERCKVKVYYGTCICIHSLSA